MADSHDKIPDFSSLTENLSQQQAKISALKELVRQSEQQHGKNTATAQEKVKNIAQRLSNLKSKASKSKQHRATSEISDDLIEEDETETANIPSTRARSETPGSEKISLLRKQMELNRMKMAERENKSKEIEQMVTQLKSKFESSQMSLERSVELGRSMGDLSLSGVVPSMLQNRSFTISDVSEQHQQQQSSQPLNFESERIKFLEKRIRDLETKENLTESEVAHKYEAKIMDLEENVREKESIIEARTKAVSLLTENLSKKKKDVVDSLEETKQEMFKMQETFLDAELTYKKEVAKLSRVITEKSDEIRNLNEKCDILEKSRYELMLESSELKTKLEDVQDYSTKISELNKLNESLQKRISTLENQKYEFITDEEVVEAKGAEDRKDSQALEDLLKQRENEIEKLEVDLQEKTIEINVANANLAVLQEKLNGSKPMLFTDPSDESQAELSKLRQQLDESNKNMIKTKLKMKQMQKQIDALQKSSDDQDRINEIQALTQKIAELEEEKGSYQLQLVGKIDSDLEEKLKVLEVTCQNQIAAIQLLEEQKMELTEDLSKARNEVDEKVKELEEKLSQMSTEKDEISNKMNRYLNENMELLDKLEKLSKGSSAESIEMVNLLTAQEKMEIEQYQKEMVHKDDEVPVEISQELNESLRSLRMESSELMEKIELFTVERREVLEKLDALTIENQVLSGNLEKIKDEKEALESQLNEVHKDYQTLKSEKEEMNKKMKEILELPTPQGSPSKAPESVSIDKEACEKLLKQLDAEIQNLHKNKDKNQKLKISKKLSDNAKNVHAMMTNLLVEFYKNLDECKELRQEVEKFKILMQNNDQVENLQKLLDETSTKLASKTSECDDLQNRLQDLQESNSDTLNAEINLLKSEIESLNDDCSRKDEIIANLQDTIDALSSERDHCEKEVQSQMALVSDLRKEFDQLCADVKVNNQKLNEKSHELDQLQHEFDMRLKTSTNENEILKTLVAEQKQLLIDAYQEHELDINQKVNEINEYQGQVKELKDEIEVLRSKDQESYVKELQNETKKLKDMLNNSNLEVENQKDELLHKQETIDTLNTQIIDLYKTMEENSNKIIEKDDELQYIQEIVDTNRAEIRKMDEKLSSADKKIQELQEKLSEKTREMELMQQKTAPVVDDTKIKQLQAEIQVLDTKNKEQLDKLKKYAANLKKKQTQCSELEERLAAVENRATDTSELNQLRAQIIQYEEQLRNTKVEHENLQKSSNKNEIEDLRWKVDEYEDMIDKKSKEIDNLNAQLKTLSEKCDQIEETSYELQSELNKMNAVQQKYEACQGDIERLTLELENARKLNQEVTQKLQEGDSKDEKKKMDKLKAAVVQLKHKLADKKKETEDLTAELNNLKAIASNAKEVEDLKQQIKELDEMNEKILSQTKKAYDNDIGLLRQRIDDLESQNRDLNEEKQRKVSLEGQLETFEMTNIELREKVARLEEAVASLDAEKNALVREKLSLDRELEEKVNDLACIDAKYQQYVNDLIKQDELISRKLRDVEADNCQLSETVKEMSDEKNLLIQKLRSLETQVAMEAEKDKQQVNNLESSNQQLIRQIEQLQVDIKKLHATHEQALAVKHAEIDEMESQFSAQMQKIEADKKSIQEVLEKANDQIIDFQDEVVRLKDNVHSLENARSDLEREMSWLKLQNDNYTQDQLENEQLRMQLMQSETELENIRAQNESMTSNHDAEVLILRQQISDLEAMRSQVSQNQTDDQVMLQNENVKLKELLIEKETEIHQKTIQLQMATVFEAPMQAVNDPFANLAAAPAPDKRNLEDNLKQSQDEIEKLREAQMMANMELDMQSGRIQQLLDENSKLQEKVREMQSMMDSLIRTNVELESASERKETEINEIRNELHIQLSQSTQSTDDDKFHALQTELAEKNHAIENLQKILQKYENPQQQQQQQQRPQAFTTSMFFDDPIVQDPFSNVNIQPVVEEEIKPKKAYLLYDSKSHVESQTDECWLDSQNKLEVLQSQLQVMEQKILEQHAELEAQRRQIVDMQVQQAQQAPQSQSNTSHLFESNPQSMAALEIEDGWGWGSENAEMTQMQARPSLLSPRSDLEVRLQEQRDIVERLEHDKNALNEELQNYRENSKKMMKKLKEYQQKIKDLETRRGSSADSNDMNMFIQEELNSQVQKLECKLKEVIAEHEKDKLEKDGLMKKIEVLSTANDRMLEMKERQDSQMELYQLKIKDLSHKIHNLEEWQDDAQKPVVPVSSENIQHDELNKTIQELNAQIKDIQADYEELQAMFEEEKQNNETLEQKLAKLKADGESKDEEMSSLTEALQQSRMEKDKLSQELERSSAELLKVKQQMEQELKAMEVKYSALEARSIDQTKIVELERSNAELLHIKSQLEQKLKELEAKTSELKALELRSPEFKSQEPNTTRITELERSNAELLKEKSQMEHELQVLNDHVLASLEFEDRMKSTVFELDAKNLEIQMLKSTLEKVQSQSSEQHVNDEIEKLRHEKEELELNMKSSIDLLNAQWSQMVEQRGNEVASSWKQHLEMRETEFSEIEATLRSQIVHKQDVGVSAEKAPEDVENMLKMKSIMESQEVEIVSLKEQLAIRSAEYAALSAKVDPYHQMSTSMSVSPVPSTEADKVPRSELDLALYMLHQRDMRLEEMTMELVRLLEERDQLQLRLSNAIRQLEDIKKKVNIDAGESSDQSTPEKTSPPVVNVEDDNLKAKLSELNTVRHSRDKVIADDREKRFMEHISMFQRDVANIPPEAAARIVSNSDQSQQSPSSVLMNWILGKKPESS